MHLQEQNYLLIDVILYDTFFFFLPHKFTIILMVKVNNTLLNCHDITKNMEEIFPSLLVIKCINRHRLRYIYFETIICHGKLLPLHVLVYSIILFFFVRDFRSYLIYLAIKLSTKIIFFFLLFDGIKYKCIVFFLL